MEWKTTVNSWLKTSIAWPTKRFYGRFAQKPDGFLNPVGPVPQPAEQTSSTRAKLWFQSLWLNHFICLQHRRSKNHHRNPPQKRHFDHWKTPQADKHDSFRRRSHEKVPASGENIASQSKLSLVSDLSGQESFGTPKSWFQMQLKTELHEGHGKGGRIPVICCLNAVCGRWCMLRSATYGFIPTTNQYPTFIVQLGASKYIASTTHSTKYSKKIQPGCNNTHWKISIVFAKFCDGVHSKYTPSQGPGSQKNNWTVSICVNALANTVYIYITIKTATWLCLQFDNLAPTFQQPDLTHITMILPQKKGSVQPFRPWL